MSQRVFFLLAGLAAVAACGRLGALKTERFACATSGDCADGYECLGGECAVPGDDAGVGGGGGGGEGDAGGGGGDPDAGGGGGSDDGGTDAGSDGGTDAGTARDAGVACTNTSQCLAGLTCVDGVCCTTACNAACDSCNQAGNLGTCLPRPAGAAVTACGLYACDGIAVTCPTSCDPDAGVNACAPTGRCEGSTCLPCWSGVTDTFSGTSSAWVFTPSPATAFAEAVQDGGRLVVSLQARPQDPQYASATSAQASGLTSCGVTFELTSPPVLLGTGYVARAQLFRDTASQRPAYGWAIDQRGLVATWDLVDGGSGSQVLPLDGGAFPRWLRVQEAGGQVQWRTTSGTSFSTVHAVTHDGQLDALKLRFDATFPTQGQNPVVVYSVDNLNRGP